MMLKGKAVSRGIAIGEVLRYTPFIPSLTQKRLTKDEIETSLKNYTAAKKRARAELKRLTTRLALSDPEQARIIAAHEDILMDFAMDEEIRNLVEQEYMSPDSAIEQVYGAYADILSASPNELMRERSADLLDVKNRLLRCWIGKPEQNLSALERPVVVAADDLYPSDTASIDRAHVLGIITEMGGSTSHTAIIARNYGIPAVLGVSGAMEQLADAETVILDGESGTILLSPTPEELIDYQERAREVTAELQAQRIFLNTESVTLDGTRIQVLLNIAAATDEELAEAAHVDGCGLFRTEFLYMEGDHMPSEEEQYQVYRKVLKSFGDQPVILRTMDIGGDKPVPALVLPKETNPFLGIRGLRLSLDRMELLRIQARAIIRASVHGNLKVMLPMVGALDEFRRAKAVFQEQEAALDMEGIPRKRNLKLGIMVEVPSVALIADLAAEEVDFASVGTNDLIQYLCAADRMNPSVRGYYQEYHPAVFRVLAHLVKAFQQVEKDISVCGELGGDPLALPVLIGLGFRQFSMGASSLAKAKQVIRSLSLSEAQALAADVLQKRTHCEVEERLNAFFKKKKES